MTNVRQHNFLALFGAQAHQIERCGVDQRLHVAVAEQCLRTEPGQLQSVCLAAHPVQQAVQLLDVGVCVAVVDLDSQVKQVFLLADCEPEFIADSLGLPVNRVQRILEGWRQTAKALLQPKPQPPAEPAAPLPPPGAAGEKQRNGSYSAEEISVIRNLWREGKTCREIADTIERPSAGFQQWVQKHRDICPKRRVEG